MTPGLRRFESATTLSQGDAFSFLSNASANKNSTCLWMSISSPLTHVWGSRLFKLTRMWLKACPLPAPLTYGDKWTLACIVLLTRPHSVSLVFVTGQWWRDANETGHTEEGRLQIFPFWSFINLPLPTLSAFLFWILWPPLANIFPLKRSDFLRSGAAQIVCVCVFHEWFFGLWPSLKGVVFCFFLGWDYVGGWMTTGPGAGSVSRYTSDPHLDLKPRLFMHDREESSTLHIHLRPLKDR